MLAPLGKVERFWKGYQIGEKVIQKGNEQGNHLALRLGEQYVSFKSVLRTCGKDPTYQIMFDELQKAVKDKAVTFASGYQLPC